MRSFIDMVKDSSRTPEERREMIRDRFLKLMLGSKEKNGFLKSLIMYTLLISIGFIYLYPLIYMFVTSMMPLEDLLNSSVKWLPSRLYTKNYTDAYATMEYAKTLLKTIYLAGVPTICQVIVCSFAGYGFARYDFPFKKILMVLMIFSFVIPPQITMMPTYVLYADLGLLGSMKAFVLPAILGQGFKSAIFILIFYNFHKQIPPSLIEAAEIDGAGHIRSYFKIALPNSIPAIVIALLFSFVWYWNETYLVNLYLGFGNNRAGLTTLQLELQRFEASYLTLYPQLDESPNRLNEAIRMAGTLLSILPLLVLYFVLQKQFVESIDKSGITGE